MRDFQCSCENAKLQEDCLSDYCTWDANSSSCSNKPCSSFGENDCENVLAQLNCVWSYLNDACEAFTKCSDYSFKSGDGIYCYSLNGCQLDVTSIDNKEGGVKCMERTSKIAFSVASCDKVEYGVCRWLVTSDGKQCIDNKSTSTCDILTITSCSDYKDAEYCNRCACYWDEFCKPLTCSMLTKEECNYFYSFDSKQVT
ncbi:unnamed protein product [Paramecium sonneborni]|uniref:Uncharacterized protein n=1 Tax=Paramecium sonneborni TaxID=65129 RepID=A0A8S1P8D3_9CILI|nr:unnamed protein product [Paramecium sonneborni]